MLMWFVVKLVYTTVNYIEFSCRECKFVIFGHVKVCFYDFTKVSRKAETVRPAVVMSCKYYNSRMTTPIGLVPTLEVGILN